MREQGFEYWAALPEDGGVPDLDLEVTPQSESEQIDASDSAKQRNLEYFDELDAATRRAYSDALLGGDSGKRLRLEHSNGAVTLYPATGCLGEARLTLLGEDDYLLLQGSLAELEGLTFEIDDRAYASPAYQDGTEELDRCLQKQGYDVPELSMDIEGFLDPNLDTSTTSAVQECAEQLDLHARFKLLQDRAAYELLQLPRVEAVIQRWIERRDAVDMAFRTASEELLFDTTP